MTSMTAPARIEEPVAVKHTPGPWSIIVDDSGDRPVAVPSIQAPDEYDCAIVHWDGFWQTHWQSGRGNKEMWANARLIAAAPDGLELAEDAIPILEAILDDREEQWGHEDEILRDLLERTKAFVAKATGA